MLKEFLKDKTIGFYVTVATAGLSLLSAILYVAFFAAEPEMSWLTFVLPLIAFLIAAVLLCAPLFLPKETQASNLKALLPQLAPPILTVANLLALCVFIYKGYVRIARIIPGRADDWDIMMFGAGLVVCLIFFLITAVAATASIFMKQLKAERSESR